MKTLPKCWMAGMTLAMGMSGAAAAQDDLEDQLVLEFEVRGGFAGIEDRLVIREDGEAYASRKLAGQEQQGYGLLLEPELEWLERMLESSPYVERDERRLSEDPAELVYSMRYPLDGEMVEYSDSELRGGWFFLVPQLQNLHELVLAGARDPRLQTLQSVVFEQESGRLTGASVSHDGVLTLWRAAPRSCCIIERPNPLDERSLQELRRLVRKLIDDADQDDSTRQLVPRIIIDEWQPQGRDLTDDAVDTRALTPPIIIDDWQGPLGGDLSDATDGTRALTPRIIIDRLPREAGGARGADSTAPICDVCVTDERRERALRMNPAQGQGTDFLRVLVRGGILR